MSAEASDSMQAESRFAPWRVIERREMFTVPGRIQIAIETVELPDGRIIDDYWQVRLCDFVVVFAETEAGEIICLRQYRHGPRRESLELIAGLIEPGEEALPTAGRELLEESGYISEDWRSLGTYTVSASQGIATVHVFGARGAVKRQEPCSGDLEDSVIELLSRERLIEAVRNGEVVTGAHLAGLLLALLGSDSPLADASQLTSTRPRR